MSFEIYFGITLIAVLAIVSVVCSIYNHIKDPEDKLPFEPEFDDCF